MASRSGDLAFTCSDGHASAWRSGIELIRSGPEGHVFELLRVANRKLGDCRRLATRRITDAPARPPGPLAAKNHVHPLGRAVEHCRTSPLLARSATKRDDGGWTGEADDDDPTGYSPPAVRPGARRSCDPPCGKRIRRVAARADLAVGARRLLGGRSDVPLDSPDADRRRYRPAAPALLAGVRGWLVADTRGPGVARHRDRGPWSRRSQRLTGGPGSLTPSRSSVRVRSERCWRSRPISSGGGFRA
jgi:hypothetical protein